MGDPKHVKKKYTAPPHPWQKSRIDEEKGLVKEYGLKNKEELWKLSTKAKNFAGQAKRLTAQDNPQSKLEEKQLLEKLFKLGLLAKGSDVSDVLGLTLQDFMERRLQTITFKKGLARSIKQARQFVTHQHISVNGKIITSPSYLVDASEESSISFIEKSALSNEMHPERFIEKEKTSKKAPKVEEKTAKPVKEEKKAEPKKEEKKEEKKEAPKEEKKEDPKEEKKEDPKKEAKEKKE